MIKYESLKKAVSSLKLKTSNPDVDSLMSDRKLLIDPVEPSAEALRLLEGEVKDLRDEVNRLKGEQSSPKFSRKKSKADISSEEERNAIENEESKDKKAEFLAVLKYPEIPLHNNLSELGARAHVKKRDVSLQTRTPNGTQAKDTMMTIVETAKKLGINVFNYIRDKINHTLENSLAAEIQRQAQIVLP